MALSHRKKTVGKRTTIANSPPGDRKVKRRKRGATHPSFINGASPSSAFKRSDSNLKARTRVNIPWDSRSRPKKSNVRPHEPHTPMHRAPHEEGSYSTHFSAKRQRDKRPLLSNSMRARLGPQEPRRPRPPVATTWGAHLDPMVTLMVKNVQPHLAVRQAGKNFPNEPPIGSIGKRLDDMLSTPFCSHIIHYEAPREFLATTRCYAKYFPPSYKGRPSHGFIAYLPTLEFVKRFGQAILQVEAYSMDAVLQIFKRNICPGTPFFESLAKKPPATMDDLFRCANKYSMLEDDVRAATQQVLVVGQTSRSGTGSSAKLPDWPRPPDRRQEGPSCPERPPLTPLSISYEKILPMI
ncbi:hypothetical protein CK203_009047 [Vitis vinifera]|uniref:Uncharacterized protein n=1 Tax=Vitis vinifera TaxID=29760 RepID=A0A438K2F7_VITVI|nr:hypothetical protein CK203_009047 [Vitis vinifera]